MKLLHALLDARAFAPAIPFGPPLASVHVPFDDLVGGRAHEGRVARIADTGGLLRVVGGTGEGKSGLVSYALSIEAGRLAVPVPVSVRHPAGANAAQVPELVLDGLANTLSSFDEGATARAQIASLGLRKPRRVSGSVNLKGVQLAVGDLLQDHRHLTHREQVDAIHQAAQACCQGGLSPVLVLDDTDKWSQPGDRLRAGRAFFDEALAAVVELGLPVVANAHPRYFEDGRGSPDLFDARVQIPRVEGSGVTRILAHRVAVAAGSRATTQDVFENDVLALLANVYESGPVPIRRIVQLVSEALIEAVEAGLDRINVGAVEAAITASG